MVSTIQPDTGVKKPQTQNNKIGVQLTLSHVIIHIYHIRKSRCACVCVCVCAVNMIFISTAQIVDLVRRLNNPIIRELFTISGRILHFYP